MELILLRLKPLNLFRGHDDVHVVDDHALGLDGNIAFAVLLKRELVVPLLVKFYVKICELGCQLLITFKE